MCAELMLGKALFLVAEYQHSLVVDVRGHVPQGGIQRSWVPGCGVTNTWITSFTATAIIT
jgi:hypothetical protein